MKNIRTEMMRKDLIRLSAENKELKAQLKIYDKNGFKKLVDDTLRMKNRYETLMKETAGYRNEYERAVLEQRELMENYGRGIKKV